MLADDKEKALEQMRPERREEYRKAFENKEKFDKWAKTLPESIENLTIKNNQAVYSWDKKDGYKHTIEFTKNQEGYWQIDII